MSPRPPRSYPRLDPTLSPREHQGPGECWIPEPLAGFPGRLREAILTSRGGLPVVYMERDYVDAGGLMSYGPTVTDLFRHAATYVDKILKGANPGDLPVEQSTKFELIINTTSRRPRRSASRSRRRS